MFQELGIVVSEPFGFDAGWILDLSFGPTRPEGTNEKNWIQTLNGRAFLVTIRLYGSGTEFYDQTWKPDDVIKAKVIQVN